MEIQCCVCKKVRRGVKWVRPADLPPLKPETVSHGYCPKCAKKAFAEIERAAARKGALGEMAPFLA